MEIYHDAHYFSIFVCASFKLRQVIFVSRFLKPLKNEDKVVFFFLKTALRIRKTLLTSKMKKYVNDKAHCLTPTPFLYTPPSS